jgi:ribosomal protein S18 acetylase RimI-like enzyme
VNLRRATTDDAAALAALALKTFLDAFLAVNRAEDMDVYCREFFGEEQQRRELENAQLVTLVVEDAGTLIAFAQVRPTPGHAAGDAEVVRFYVEQSHHGRGIAQTLMAAVLTEAHALGAATLWLGVWEHNSRAIAFYTKCGFLKVGSHPFILGTDVQTDWEMAIGLP